MESLRDLFTHFIKTVGTIRLLREFVSTSLLCMPTLKSRWKVRRGRGYNQAL